MRYEVSLSTTNEYNGGQEYYSDCSVRETPQYLEINDVRSQTLKTTRFLHPWHTINRAIIKEIPGTADA